MDTFLAALRGARDLGDALHLLPRGALFCDSALRSVLEDLRADGRSALADSVSLVLCPDEPAPKRPRLEASDTDSSGVDEERMDLLRDQAGGRGTPPDPRLLGTRGAKGATPPSGGDGVGADRAGCVCMGLGTRVYDRGCARSGR